MKALLAPQKGLGKAAEPQQMSRQRRGRGLAALHHGEGVQPVVVVAALQRVAALAVVVEPGRPGHEEGDGRSMLVVQPLDEAAP